MSQVPSDRRVTTEPSGRVTLAVENAWLPAVPDTDDPALDEAEPPPECIVVVFPSIVVDEVTLPPPAVTEDEVLPPAEVVLSITVQVVPSSSLIVSADNASHAMQSAMISGRANALLVIKDAEFISCPPEEGRSPVGDRPMLS
jgi:hypothetical protein